MNIISMHDYIIVTIFGHYRESLCLKHPKAMVNTTVNSIAQAPELQIKTAF